MLLGLAKGTILGVQVVALPERAGSAMVAGGLRSRGGSAVAAEEAPIVVDEVDAERRICTQRGDHEKQKS